MEKAVVIFNPIAGHLKSDLLEEMINNFVKEHNLNSFDVYRTKRAGHAEDLVKQAIDKFGDPLIFCFGGDGTIAEAINGIVDSDATLAIIPTGSGNDFIKTLTNNDKTILKNIYDNTVNGEVQTIDVGMINNQKAFANSMSIGLDADIAKRVYMMRNKSYIGAILPSLLKFKYPRLHISYNTNNGTKELDKEITLLAICNGRFYGGGFQIAPQAILNDGLFDLCIVDKIPKSLMPFYLPSVLNGKHEKHSFVNTDKTDYIKIESDKIFTYQYDGEISMTNELEVAVLKNRVKVIKPRKNH